MQRLQVAIHFLPCAGTTSGIQYNLPTCRNTVQLGHACGSSNPVSDTCCPIGLSCERAHGKQAYTCVEGGQLSWDFAPPTCTTLLHPNEKCGMTCTHLYSCTRHSVPEEPFPSGPEMCQLITEYDIKYTKALVCSMGSTLSDACRSTSRSPRAMHGCCVPADVPQHHLLPRRLPVLGKLSRGAPLQLCRLLHLPAQHLPSRAPGA